MELKIYNGLKFSLTPFNRKFPGNSDLHNGVEFGWLYTLAETSRQPYTHVEYAEDNVTIYKIQVGGGMAPLS